MTVGFLLYLAKIAIICVIIWLLGTWLIRFMDAKDPVWPKILALLIVLIVLGAVVAPLLGIGGYLALGPP